MRETLLLTCIFLLFITSTTQAQPPSNSYLYNFTASNATYSYVTGGTDMSSWVGDDNYATVPIGFNFNFCGSTYTNVVVSNNGWVSFASPAAAYNAPPGNLSGIIPAVFPFWFDLDGTTSGSASYIVTGSAPNRVFTFEWQHWGIWQSIGSVYDILSFQVKLYENGFIEFKYKPEANSVAFSPAIGIAKTTADYLFLSNTSSSPVASSTTQWVVSGIPAAGQSYLFSFCNTPTVLSQPQSITQCSGDIVSFNVGANNAISYQWQENNGTGFVNLSNTPLYNGVNTAVLTINGIPNSYNGYAYRCVLTGTCPAAVNTNNANVILSDAVVIYSVTPSKTVCEGNPTQLDVVAAGSGLKFNWQMQDHSGNYFNIPTAPPYSGTNTSTLNISEVEDSINNRLFRVNISPTTTCPSAVNISSSPINLSVNLQPQVNPPVATSTEGSQIRFIAAVTGNTNQYTYQWQEDKKDATGYYNLQDNANYSGSNNDTLYINDAMPQQNHYHYRCIIFGNTGCDAGYIVSKQASLNIVSVSVGNLTDRSGISVYPNPVSGNEISVAIDKQHSVNAIIRVTDQLGRVLQTSNINNQGQKTISIDVKNLAIGVYMLQLSDPANNISQSVSFVKQ